ncbi:hypothetical protein CH063_09585, partial [Colletotrichum higginsianum]
MSTPAALATVSWADNFNDCPSLPYLTSPVSLRRAPVMAWQPTPESLSQLATCLKDSLSGFDKNAQKQAELMLTQAKSSPDINNYLAYLFSSAEPPQGVQCTAQDYHLVRSAAAIMLKNN